MVLWLQHWGEQAMFKQIVTDNERRFNLYSYLLFVNHYPLYLYCYLLFICLNYYCLTRIVLRYIEPVGRQRKSSIYLTGRYTEVKEYDNSLKVNDSMFVFKILVYVNITILSIKL